VRITMDLHAVAAHKKSGPEGIRAADCIDNDHSKSSITCI
jgi:hypothetical protein